MNARRGISLLTALLFSYISINAQTPADAKQFNNDGVIFSYLSGWTLEDNSTGDAQQLTLARADSDAQIRIFVHRGRITEDKLPQARRSFIDPYIEATSKQFIAMGAKPEQSPDTLEVGGVKAEGVNIKASLGGEVGAAGIYWALLGQRVVMLTLFGPDTDLKKHAANWDLVRTSLRVQEKSPTAKPSPIPE